MTESFERGALTESVFYILLALYSEGHGGEIARRISDMTDGRVDIPLTTLYYELGSLVKKGLISEVEYDNPAYRKKRDYIVTERGKECVTQEVARMKACIVCACEVLEARNNPPEKKKPKPVTDELLMEKYSRFMKMINGCN